MLFDILALVSAGFAAGGVALLAQRLSGRRLPRWIVPGAAGAAMLAYAVWSEYSWFGRTSAALPEGVVVAARNSESAPWRPWTYLWPITDLFVAVDRRTRRTHAGAPGQSMVDVHVIERWQPVRSATVLFDCRGRRRAELGAGVDVAPDGTVAEAAWEPLPADDPVLLAACAEV
jgi:hypothetical protein